jgi:16S rRNA processing protein RimM
MGTEAERAPTDQPAGEPQEQATPASLTPSQALLAQAMGAPVRPETSPRPATAPRSSAPSTRRSPAPSRLARSARTISPDTVLLTVARVLRPHGTRGEISCEVITEFPQRFRRTRRVFLSPPPEPGSTPSDGPLTVGDGAKEYAVEQARIAPRKGHSEVILRLAGLTDRDVAAALRGSFVQVPESEAWKLPNGRFYWHQIVGLRVVTIEGEEIGTVAEILETGANDVYIVRSDGRERLIPAIKDVVKEIAPERGEMIVELIPGL